MSGPRIRQRMLGTLCVGLVGLALAGCVPAQSQEPSAVVSPPEAFAAIGPDYRVIDSTEGLDAPYGVGVTSDGDRLYVSGGNGDASGIARIALDGTVDWLGHGVTVPGLLALDGDSVYVVDRGDGSVDVSHDRGETWALLPGAQVAAPEGIAARHGVIAISSPSTDSLLLSSDGGVTWRTVDAATGGFAGPAGVAIDVDGTVFVVNSRTGSVSVGASGGASWTTVDAAQTGFVAPYAIAAGPDGVLYVTDPGASGLARSVDHGASWTSSDGFANAWAVGVAPDGSIYLTDGIQTVVQLAAVPGPVSGLAAAWNQDGTLGVTWAGASVNGGSAVTGQTVRVEPQFDATSWAANYPSMAPDSDQAGQLTSGWTSGVDASATSATIAGLPSGVPVRVLLSTSNDVGESASVELAVAAR